MTNIMLSNVIFSRKLAPVEGTSTTRLRRILDGISLEILDGQRLGILGSNGAGKTTLLRLIAGIFEPDEGSIQRGSDISALLDTGYGMVDSLTARENCISKLIVAGIPKREIPPIIDWIQDFAEIGEYFDQPMRSFSSGMFARIVFALATARPHKVVVIDEGFGLADEHFRRKAQSVLQRLYADASILVFASHNAELLRSTCDRGIVLNDGKIAFDGSISDAINFNNSY
jgi:ABC-2 type transport system ATP-binding protein/lipopolysaccharide transport system ATP-binding protein